MKYGARNQVTATVTEVKKDKIMAQVSFSVSVPATMGSVMTVDSLNELSLKPGDKVKLLVKTINVLVAKEELSCS
jgi:molybdopterin-binding protein